MAARSPGELHCLPGPAAAQRNIADAQLKGLSTETRLDAAYKAIMQADPRD